MNDKYNLTELQNTFFNDPRWAQVEALILDYIEPLLDMTTVDTSRPAEDVKAEIVGRTIAYNKLYEFLNSAKIAGRKPREIKSQFR